MQTDNAGGTIATRVVCLLDLQLFLPILRMEFSLACGDTRGASWETGHGAQRYQAAIRLYRIGVQGQCGRIEDIEELPIFAEDHVERLTAWNSSYRSAIYGRQ